MADDIIDRLQCSYRKGEWPCEECTFCAARAEIERLRAEVERLRAAGDALAAAQTDHLCDFCDSYRSECVAIRDALDKWEEARRG